MLTETCWDCSLTLLLALDDSDIQILKTYVCAQDTSHRSGLC